MQDYSIYSEKLKQLQTDGNLRFLRDSIPANCINVSSNDYLGLLQNQELYEEFLDELESNAYHLSSASSRLLSGNCKEYTELENLLAKQFKREAALVYNSGYHANCGIIPALAQKNDLIIADKLVHASIIDGLQLSSAKFERYKHLDYEHLEKIIVDNKHLYNQIFIVSESIFSMDGDCADLQKLVEIKKRHNAYLYIDEAHAFGVRGENGLGCVEEYDVIKDVDFIVGTFGKAISSVGAYIICDTLFKNYLINHSRTLIFTTALPPINVAYSKFIIQQLPQFSSKRNNLQKLQKEFSALLKHPSESHIIPYIIGSNADAIQASEVLQKNGFFVLPIRYPTVPKNTARLRFSLQANMKIQDLQKIITYLPK